LGLARQVHMRLRVRPDGDLATTLNDLVRYFRAFEPGEIRQPTGNLYWDLASSQRGVCRHRSFAFMITANALGIPTRFVSNEAHAFAEVWVPVHGWLRIDLGGASNSFDVKNAEEKSMYRPRGADPFDKPPAYRNGSYSNLGGNVNGLTHEQIEERA